MHVHLPTENHGTKTLASARALGAALALYGAALVLISSCGGQGLTFPGNVAVTPTPQFTATPTP
ncbi:MAG: hypothetical protein ACRDQZ_05470 [Mycobacteriales bacterium]